CGVCLSRQSHDVMRCNSPTLWNGKPARSRRDSKGHITNPRGQALCVEWQRPRSC
ncbi:hypothetical protein K488DRAFT_29469, partial [Vararia minispora EC-137]